MSISIKTFWLEFTQDFIDADGSGLCGLCANRGVLDTRGHVKHRTGKDVGVLRWCICPNGRTMKKTTGLKAPDDLK